MPKLQLGEICVWGLPTSKKERASGSFVAFLPKKKQKTKSTKKHALTTLSFFNSTPTVWSAYNAIPAYTNRPLILNKTTENIFTINVTNNG